ncbi:MAG: hypothetical protein DWQ31_08435 [Planctomycetota bacterium]|nr:MAG: hypothetical protein DWQ31_08435 [Planctomycetota bacterium]REJ86975.1 MAG: hypothetical protein DWQ35_22735 [Planctomycetota bacterium]REK48486.1 MAG: hypothetical protein DWQ46_01965 [Planctomycetota bacterium]
MGSISYRRSGAWVCLVALVCFPVFVYGALQALASNTNDVMDWLPKGFQEYRDLEWFGERFGSDELLMISWPGCTLDDARLDALAQRLVEPVEDPSTTADTVYFDRVFTGRETLAQLRAPPAELSRRVATERMRGWLLGEDGKTTCAVALIKDEAIPERAAAVAAVYRVTDDLGISRDELRLGGPTIDSVAINAASEKWLLEMGGVSALCGLLLAWLCLRRVRLVAAVFATAAFAWAVSLSLVYLFSRMDAVLLMMPGLIYVLAISGAVHMTGYYTDALRERDNDDALLRAIRHGWVPCALASFTTAIGLGSLAVSQIVPIVKFGVFSSVGVLVALAALFLLWPALLERWPRGSSGAVASTQASPSVWWQPLFRLATRRWILVLVVILPLVPLLVWGVTQIRTTVTLSDMFHRDSVPIRNYAWLEENIGPLVPVEVIIQLDRPTEEERYPLFQRAKILERVRREIAERPEVGAALAVSTFVPELPAGRSVRDVARRGIVQRRMEESREEFHKLRFLVEEDDAELWRISARVPALGDVDYPALLADLRSQVDRLLTADAEAVALGATSRVAGGVPLVCAAQQQLLEDLGVSFLTAFVLIAIAMTVIIGRPAAGLISMLPNVLPALLLFGLMGWLGRAVDIGAMMTASVALGIAVDDTSHFLIWYRRGLLEGRSQVDAIRLAYASSATAMLHTTLICGLGLLVFAASPFVPISQFAWLMCGLLLAALLGDLIVLPALLASPLGRAFRPRSDKERTHDHLEIDGHGDVEAGSAPSTEPPASAEPQPETDTRRAG